MNFDGIFTPAITPLAPDGQVDYSAFDEVLEYLVESRVHGIIIGGSTGEYYAHTPAERLAIAERAKSVLRVVCHWWSVRAVSGPKTQRTSPNTLKH